MRQSGVVLSEFIPQREERFFRLAIARDEAKRPIGDLLLAGEPFVRPGKENRPGESAVDHAVDVPAEHLRLLVLECAGSCPCRIRPG